MRSKNIISTVAFVSAFVFSAAFASLFINESQPASFESYAISNVRTASCSADDKTCTDITALLIQDIRNGDRRNSRYDYSFDDEDANVSVRRAESVVLYSAASRDMEDSHLPSDFRAAWRDHMKAWRVYSEFLTKVSQTKIEDDKFENLESEYVYDINKTWAKVLKIGRGYGAESQYIY